MQSKLMRRCLPTVLAFAIYGLCSVSLCAARSYTVEEAVAIAKKQNLDIAVARKQVEAARGSLIEARAGFLPAVISTGLARQREHQAESRLRDQDYNASVRVVQNLYTGGAVSAQNAIARLNIEKQECELQAITDRVAMDVRIACYDSLLDRAKVRVREQSVGVLQEELKTQQQRLSAGIAGELNVRRAEVALANEQPELIEAQTRLQNNILRLHELLALRNTENGVTMAFEVAGQLRYQPRHPDLNECLGYAETARPEVLARQKDVQIAEQELELDRSELRPRVEAFSGYEIYNERDPDIGREFNHGYVLGLNATWHIFDGFATKGRMQATRARRDAAVAALNAARLSVASDVRSSFLDLEQADRTLREATKNVQNADESLELAKGNLSAGLGTQLDTLQAASDVTRTRTTRLTAIYLHNLALARLARATAREPGKVEFQPSVAGGTKSPDDQQILYITRPPAGLGKRK
ncbi:MAG: TolC family protein [Chthoniobacterales bacterium]